MDVRQLTHLFFRVAAKSSLVLLGSAVALAGDRRHEQPTRPHTSAAYSSNWGFNRTCWSRFPAVPDCPGTSCEFSREGYGYENTPSQQVLYAPQNAMMHEQKFASPGYAFPNSPISVYPNTSPAVSDTESGGAEGPAASGNPQHPAPHVLPYSPVPGVPSALPPLPAPPLPAPGQSSWQPHMMGPHRQVMNWPVSASGSTLQTGARYGIPRRYAMPASASAPVAAGSYTGTLVSNTRSPSTASTGSRYGTAMLAQQMPVVRPKSPETYGPVMYANRQGMTPTPFALASQSREQQNAAAPSSYPFGNVMPSEHGPDHPLLHQTQLPQTSNYRAMPPEPLRRTP